MRAIHLVGPGGEEWWIEGATSIADYHRLQQIYPNIDHAHFIAGAWRNDGLTAEDVLNAVVVSMGTMGVIYSMVLEVVPQFGIQQIVTSLEQNSDGTSGWSQLLGKAGTSEAALRSGDAAANISVLELLLDGTQNGTTKGIEENVYCDLAINPFNRDCWITNRRAIPQIPIDSNSPSLGFGDYLKALDKTLGSHHDDTFNNSKLLGRIFDFFGWATAGAGLINVPGQAQGLASFLREGPTVHRGVRLYTELKGCWRAARTHATCGSSGAFACSAVRVLGRRSGTAEGVFGETLCDDFVGRFGAILAAMDKAATRRRA